MSKIPASIFDRTVSVSLRAATLLSKFALIFVLAKYLPPEELGVYGLVSATIGYAIFFLGMDFYTFSNREIIKVDATLQGRYIKSQFLAYLLFFVALAPLFLILFILDLMPWAVVGWFFAILIVEHLSQELMRLLVALSHQVAASIVLFVRFGLWALILSVVIPMEQQLRSLNTVWIAWFIGGAVAVGYGFFRVSRMKLGGWERRADFSWVISGVKIALPFLLATIALRSILTLDRYLIEVTSGLELLGVYVFFMGISMSLLSFLESAVFSFYYPTMIQSHAAGDAGQFREVLWRMVWQSSFVIVFFLIVALTIIRWLLHLIGHAIYVEEITIFRWVLAAVTLFSMSMIPHYGLYSQGFDRPIIYSHIFGLLAFLVAFIVGMYEYPERSVMIALIFAFAFIFAFKLHAFIKLSPERYYRTKS